MASIACCPDGFLWSVPLRCIDSVLNWLRRGSPVPWWRLMRLSTIVLCSCNLNVQMYPRSVVLCMVRIVFPCCCDRTCVVSLLVVLNSVRILLNANGCCVVLFLHLSIRITEPLLRNIRSGVVLKCVLYLDS